MWAAIGWAIVRMVVVMAISYLVSQATARKQSNNSPEAVGAKDWNFPQVDEGTPQCVFEDWQVLAYGNYRTTEIKKG